jgi:hypothetical protein
VLVPRHGPGLHGPALDRLNPKKAFVCQPQGRQGVRAQVLRVPVKWALTRRSCADARSGSRRRIPPTMPNVTL